MNSESLPFLYREGANVPKRVSRVEFDKNVTCIEERAFQDCESLLEIIIPEGVTEIGKRAFDHCTSLASIKLPKSLKFIGEHAFSNCLNLTSIKLPQNLNSIRESAFSYCSKLTNITLPENLTSLGEYTFRKCTNLTSVELPQSLTSIGEYAFHYCSSLTSVTIPKNIKSIEYSSFGYCKSLTRIKLQKNLSSIGENAFCHCSNLASVKLPDGLKFIGKGSFSFCTNLTSVRLPDTLKSIRENAFSDCSNLTNIQLPDGLVSIGPGAFKKCSNLSMIKLSKSLTSIEKDLFNSCSNLTRCQLHYGLISIEEGAFHKCSNLTSIKLPETLNSIGDSAFSECSNLTSIKLPESLTSIGQNTFLNCKSICSIVFPKYLKSIEDGTFMGCSRLMSIVLPDNLVDLGEEAFKGCSSLVSIILSEKHTTDYIPNNICKIRLDCFQECSKLLKGKRNDNEALIGWLSRRFEAFPLHSICSTIHNDTTDFAQGIQKCILNNPGCAEQKDEFSSTALHYLASNPNVTKECLEIVIKAYPDALSAKDDNGMLPQHLLLLNPQVSADLFISRILNAKTMNGKYAISIGNDYYYSVSSFAMYLNCVEEVQYLLYSRHPVERDSFRNLGEWYYPQFDKIERKYINKIKSLENNWNRLDEHGWVRFLDIVSNANGGDEIMNFIKSEECDRKHAQKLAYAKDHDNRVALNVAGKELQDAMKDKIFFLGRYEMLNGSTLHESYTCIVKKATDMKSNEYYSSIFNKFTVDNNKFLAKDQVKTALEYLGLNYNDDRLSKLIETWDKEKNQVIDESEFQDMCKDLLHSGENRSVALKFMKNKDQFKRELDIRKEFIADSERNHYYLEIDDHHDFEEEGYALGEFKKELEPYTYLLVMSLATRSLEEIIRSERPNNEIKRGFVRNLLDCLQYIHENGIIHGDLKPSNIVYFRGRLRMIDFDASSYISREKDKERSKFYAGKKFSSGTLPPEMIFECRTENHASKFQAYFENESGKDDEFWRKLQPKKSGFSGRAFVVKTFLTEQDEDAQVESVLNAADLPYELVKAAASIDMWALGTIIYFIYTGQTLFDLDINGDLKDGNAMRELRDWMVKGSNSKLEKVTNKNMKRLLMSLLSEIPEKRSSLGDAKNIIDEDLSSDTESIEKDLNMSFESILSDFDETSVNIPTSFIILPGQTTIDELAKFGKEVIEELIHFQANDKFSDNFFQKITDDKFYLYLIDEHDCSIVKPQGPYPIPIEEPFKLFEMMSVFLTTMKYHVSAAKFAQLFFPTGSEVPEEFISYIDESFMPQQFSFTFDEDCVREFEALLLTKDENRNFSGLVRAHNPDDRKAMWVSRESFEKMKETSGFIEDSADTKYREKLQEKSKELEKKMKELDEQKHEIDGVVNENERLKKELQKFKKMGFQVSLKEPKINSWSSKEDVVVAHEVEVSGGTGKEERVKSKRFFYWKKKNIKTIG